ncbi:MAG TPA: hypothetical protein VNR70_08630 [Steroidobacteraceae bacterium]|nr:hypothetical protein [Steroidobacteraceae bacterium]
MSGIDEAEMQAWRDSVGRIATRRQRLDIESLRRFALAIDADAEVERVQPVLAHWAWFLDAVPDAELGEDGHPRRGAFLPAISLPRRMFVATRIRMLAPLELDRDAEMTLRIADVQHKRGRSGGLVFVEVERVIAQNGGTRVEERQSLVYRPMDVVRLALPAPANDAGDGEVWRPGAANLFRFSAATFNGHRVHYDHPYATEVEGYPAVVVHGTFAAAKLAQFAARRGPLSSFAFRAQAPLFLGQPIRICAVGEDEVRMVRADGAVSTIARVTYR